MLQAEYKRDMYHNYMIIEQQNAKLEEEYGQNMVINNSIYGLLPVELRMVDNKKQYYYDITSKQPMKVVFEKGKLKNNQIAVVMGNIIKIVEGAQEYLLEENDFVLEPEHIYISLSDLQVSLCYAAGYGQELKGQMTCLLEYLMNKVDYEEEKAVLLTYGLYQLCRSEDCTFDKLKSFLDSRKQSAAQEELTQEVPFMESDEKISKKPGEEYISYKNMEQKKPLPAVGKGKGIKKLILCGITIMGTVLALFLAARSGILHTDRGKPDTIKVIGFFVIAASIEGYALSRILDSDQGWEKKETEKGKRAEESWNISERIKETDYFPLENTSENSTQQIVEEKTTVLYEENKKDTVALIALNSEIYQDIPLIEFPFFVGKLKTNVDCSIENNAVSRFHAKLENMEEEYYITDLNSTNGTYINHSRLIPNTKSVLSFGDVITFANVSYRFTKN